jgi:nucleotide-binding universal stress UspA family protein
MYEKILVGADFSKYTNPLLECIGEIPGVKEVVLLNIIPRDPLARAWSPGDEEKAVAKKLEELKKPLEEKGLKVKTIVRSSEQNEEHRAIKSIADEEDVSLIVMGARGRSILAGLLLGSVSAGVLRYGNRDLLIMRYKALDENNAVKFCPMLFSNVLLPTDFSEVGNAAIYKIRDDRLAKNVALVNVVARGESTQEVEARAKQAEPKLEAIREQLVAAGINTTADVVTAEATPARTYGTGGMAAVHAPFLSSGGVADRIISLSEEKDSSLIALSSHGKGLIDELFIGSVVLDVARRGTRPVLVVRSEHKA